MTNRVVFVSDTFHHHQKGVADALFELTRGDFCFITTQSLSAERKMMGFYMEYPEYVFDASLSNKALKQAKRIIDEAEIVILGSAPLRLLRKRLLDKKITFRYSERLLKQYKHYLKTPLYIIDNLRTRGCRMLCSSAFASHDYNLMKGFVNRCYKWGYFPEIDYSFTRPRKDLSKSPRMMWCSRFLDWKHPELPLYLAYELKSKGYPFVLEMYGSGRYFERSQYLARSLGVDDVVGFCGNVPNEVIINAMQESDIFLFTSDRGEGWGVVANEAMSNGCVLVASNLIGSIPYLVKDGENGVVFRSSSRLYGFNRLSHSVDKLALSSLVEKVEWVFNNRDEWDLISSKAMNTIRREWNPHVAAKNLLTLIDDISQGNDTSIVSGPCSKA